MLRLVLGVALFAAATPVLAADYLASEPLYLEPLSPYGYSSSGWSGQYIGATLGGQRTRIDVPGSGVLEGVGLIGGIFAGVNYQEDNGLVMGAEADFEWNGFDQSSACTNSGWTCNLQGSLRARLGYASDSFHIYGTAGLAAASVGDIGWTAGLGAEVAFSDMWFGRAEYRYTALGSANSWYDASKPGVTSHAIRAGVGYRF